MCQTCGFIDYVNPRIVAGVVAHADGKILLCRRAIEPRRGLWTLPAGFLELGESVEEGARREAQEEARAELELEAMLGVYSIPRIGQVQIFYRARLLNQPSPGPESLEVMLAAWDDSTAKAGCTRRKLVANLPYVIATPLITNLLIARDDIERMVVMVQWEIAERLRAAVGTKDFNALSVLVQSVADVEVVRKVLPTNFYPRPKVDSAIVKITPSAARRARVGDEVNVYDAGAIVGRAKVIAPPFFDPSGERMNA